MIKNIFTAAFLILAAFSFAQTDTLISRRIFTPLANGLYLDTTLTFRIPRPQPVVKFDTIWKERIVYKTDTIYIGEKPKPVNLLSGDFGSLQAAINAAIEQGKPLELSQNDTIRQTIVVNGDVSILGKNYTLHNAASIGFMLNNGTHTFSDINITQHRTGVAFQTTSASGAIWSNYFDRVNVLSGQEAYLSSRGGNEQQWCITSWKNSVLQTGRICVSVFSQDGNFKALHLLNMAITSDKQFGNNTVPFRKLPDGTPDPNYNNHAIYCHPNVSLSFTNVTLTSKNLSLHHYSGGGVPGVAKYIELKKVKGGNIELNTVGDGKSPEATAIIDSSDLAPYVSLGRLPANVYATNSNFRNLGNGIMLRGTLINCTGGAWSPGVGHSLTIESSKLTEVSTRPGGNVEIRNSTVAIVWGADKGNTFSLSIRNSQIGTLGNAKGLGTIEIDADTKVNRRL